MERDEDDRGKSPSSGAEDGSTGGDAGGGQSDGGAGDAQGASHETTVLEPGAHVAGLSLIRQLGAGAQGVVFEARQESMNRVVAVKILPRTIDQTGLQVERFKREAAAAGRLNHSNIVAVHQIIEEGGHHFIVQELVRGESLDEKLDDRESSGTKTDVSHCRWAATVGAKVADALHHAHQEHVIHRDVKPSNIMLTLEGEPKVTDFGLAKVQDEIDHSQSTGILGTPYYMAPEQVDRSRGQPDARTDVYGLGATLYRMLAGRTPFQAASPNGLFIDILTRAPPPLRRFQRGVSRDLEAVCLKALEKRQEDRYQSCEELRADLERYLNGEPTKARPVGPIGSATRAVRRLATSALVVLALLIPALWFLLDALWLEKAAAHDSEFYWARFGALGVCSIGLGWVLSVLLVRRSGGKSWIPPLAWIITIALAVAAAHQTREEWAAQAKDKEWITVSKWTEKHRHTRDLTDWIASWSDRLSPNDHLKIALLYLKLDRPEQARNHISILTAPDSTPGLQLARAVLAFDWGINEALVRDKAAAEAWDAWDKSQAIDWFDLKTSGDILMLLGLHGDAFNEYTRARWKFGGHRDEIALAQFEAALDLCNWPEAEELERKLQDFMELNERRFVGWALGLRLARERDDVSEGKKESDAQKYISRLLNDPVVPPTKRLITAFDETLLHEGIESALQVLDRSVEEALGAIPIGSDTIHTCAYKAFGVGRFEEAETYYRYLLTDKNWSFAAHLGLAAVKMKDSDGDYEAAITWATAAIDRESDYYEGHLQLGLARLYRALAKVGRKVNQLETETLAEVIRILKVAVQHNGMDEQALNNLSYALILFAKKTRDSSSLDEAILLSRRAQRLQDPARSHGRTVALDVEPCKLSPVKRAWMSSTYDTLADAYQIKFELQSDRNHLAMAEGMAREALEILAPREYFSPALIEDREAHLQEISDLLAKWR